MSTCPCGWTVISPQGEGQATKHTRIHLTDVHPDTSVSEEEIKKMIRTV
ncbi:MAG: hypothetical protein HY247_06720 [archaeon]|nr:MAG: hypothetical protein HY247_06720 [archaeon]